jgi:hypothetical protein
MTAWLERREKVQQHTFLVERRQQAITDDIRLEMSPTKSLGPLRPPPRAVMMTRNPTKKAVSFETLVEDYGATYFADALGDYIASINHPGASAAAIRAQGNDTLIPFHFVPVYHKIKFTAIGLGNTRSEKPQIVDTIHVRPEQDGSRGRTIPSRFDTVLVHKGTQRDMDRHSMFTHHGVDPDTHCYSGLQVAQVRVVFQIPTNSLHRVFGMEGSQTAPTVSKHLAYVEWFSNFPATPDPNHRMYRVSRLTHHGRRQATVIEVGSIVGSVHLLPQCGPITPPEWNSFSVLEHCPSFYVNPFSNDDVYLIFS